MDEKALEAAARAMHSADVEPRRFDKHWIVRPWGEQTPEARTHWTRLAQAAITAYREASGEARDKDRSRAEYGWLVEDSRNHSSGIRYRMWGLMGPEWTNDPNKALRFARREDAEAFARDDEDAWHIVEHMWLTIDTALEGK